MNSDLLIFLTNKKLLAETIYISSLIYLKAIYEQKMKEIATKLRFWSIFPDRLITCDNPLGRTKGLFINYKVQRFFSGST